MQNVPSGQLPTPIVQPAVRSRLTDVIFEVVALVLWIYFFVKLFVFDFDTYLMEKFIPEYAWVLNFKFFIFLGLLGFTFLFARSLSSLKRVGFVVAYPVIILFWRMPKAILQQKSWILIFAAVSGIVNFFRAFRGNIIVATIILISCAAISVFDGATILWVAAAALLLSISSIYIRTILSAFRPTTIFKFYINALPPIRNHFTTTLRLDDEIRDIPKANLDDAQLKVWATKLETPVLINRLYLFLAKKFREYQQSPAPFVAGVLSIFALFFLTMAVFSFIHYSIYKIDNAAFETSVIPSFFSFVWYSFNTLMFNFIKELVPVSAIARTVWMVEATFALFLITIIVSLFFSVRSQRHASDIDDVIVALTAESQELEKFIKKEYQIDSLESAMAELDRLQAGIIKIIMWLTNNTR